MAAVNSLLLLLTTLAPNAFPPDSQPVTYTPPTEGNTYDSPVDIIGDYDSLPPCSPIIPPFREIRCPANSHYEPCGPVCPRSCIRYHCPLNCCVEGCFCDDGYVMGYNGSCIREEQCKRLHDMDLPYQSKDTPDKHPIECGPNEYISCNPEREKNCSNYRDHVPPPSEPCTMGCACMPPLVRGPGGFCILPEQCPSTPLTDATVRDWTICNFMRVINPDADCIVSDRQCDNPEECPDDSSEDENNPIVRTEVSDEMKPCLPDQKPAGPVECGPTEVFVECAPICFPTCTEYYCPLKCCVPGCYCPEGYVRGPRALCIPKDECPADKFSLSNNIQDTYDPAPVSCGPDEIISCDSHCQLNCSNYYSEFVPCADDTCVLGCVCRPPKIRGPGGDCVLPEQCHRRPPNQQDEVSKMDMMRNFLHIRENAIQQSSVEGPLFKCQKEHEYLNMCSPLCPDTCDNYDDTTSSCKKFCLPTPRCDCEKGYVRGPNGDCITPEECSNEENGPLTRNSLYVPDQCIFDFIQDKSICQDLDDWFDAADHSCLDRGMQLRNYIPSLRCGNNLFSGVEFVCCPSNDESSTTDVDENFLHTIENAVQEETVKGPFFKCRKKHEYLNMCTYTCPDTCNDYKDQSRTCKKVCLPIPRCDCEEGYVRGPSGDCITPEECPNSARMPDNCTGVEYYDPCGPACEANCTTHFGINATCERDHCKAGCFCKQGLIRGPDGHCMWPFECFVRSAILLKDQKSTLESDVCPENEEWRDCGTACPKDCTNYDEDISCTEECSRGCFCKEPRVRGPDGSCVMVEECPRILDAPAVCPENEEWRFCGTACPKDCTNYDKDTPCVAMCSTGCFCKEPRVRGPDGTCILIEECPAMLSASPLCPENEYYVECQADCQKNCTNYDKNFACSTVCKGGCVCKPPLVRGPDFTCVNVEECSESRNQQSNNWLRSVSQIPTYVCGDENQRFSFCKSICPDTCNNYKQDRFCKHICLPGCACLPGYVLSRDGVCIKQEHCVEDRPEDCSELETYNDCGSYCEVDCFNFNMASRECYTKECRKGCFCKPGWVRSPDMKCIRPYECPRRSMIPTGHGAREWPL